MENELKKYIGYSFLCKTEEGYNYCTILETDGESRVKVWWQEPKADGYHLHIEESRKLLMRIIKVVGTPEDGVEYAYHYQTDPLSRAEEISTLLQDESVIEYAEELGNELTRMILMSYYKNI